MTHGSRARVVVTDANVLINLIHVGRLDLLGALDAFDFLVPDEVTAEVLTPSAAALDDAFQAGHVVPVSLATIDELTAYAGFTQVLGKGESACLALAAARGWHIASDERRTFLRLARQHLGDDRILNTPGILVQAIREGHLSVETADDYKRVLAEHRFVMRFDSFGDVVGGAPGG